MVFARPFRLRAWRLNGLFLMIEFFIKSVFKIVSSELAANSGEQPILGPGGEANGGGRGVVSRGGS